MPFKTAGLVSVIALTAGSAAMADMSFNRIASFPTFANMAEGEDTSRETSAEIVTVTEDGATLIYSDSPLGAIGRIDITDPANPQPLGNIALDGEPTAVSALGGTVFVGVNTSESYTDPSGHLAHYVVDTGELAAECDLGGQPDSTAVAPDGAFVVVAIENERDEDLGDGRVPQMPAGYVSIVPLDDDGMMLCEEQVRADITGLADVAPEDPEPEFVDVSATGEIAVTLQENNHIVVLNAAGEVLSHFSAGAVTLEGVDTREEGALTFTDTLTDVPREPDALQWIDADHFVIANEGDMDGGSRGFTVFHKDGSVVYESGLSFERALIEIGHYPEERSGNKGVEPEGMEFAVIDGTPMIFLLAERGSIVGVYDMTDPAAPQLAQLLPSGIGPEGAVAIPERDLLVTTNEVDDAGPRSHVMIYAYEDAAPVYPQLTSAAADELIGWGAISGMVAAEDGMVYAVNDSFYAMQPTIFAIDTTTSPATITDTIRVTREGVPAQSLDMEGIALDGEGGFYVASEGRPARGRWHAIYHVDAEGEIQRTIPFPKALWAVERRHAAEGITRVGDTLWIAIQREWDDDPAGHAKVVSYNLETEEWGAVHYPKSAPEAGGWVGLSEITAHGDWMYFIERDNQFSNSAIKAVTRVPMAQMQPAPLGSELPVVEKEIVRNLREDLAGFNGYIQDKVEGMAIFEDGTTWISTDNDGVDDSSGETFFFSIGQM
jgi:DNA-binding beta-propeller fold protein YncE